MSQRRAWWRLLVVVTSAVALATWDSIALGQISFRAAAPAGPILPVAFRSAASAGAGSGVLTLTISRPAGTVQDDVMIASIGVRPNTVTVTPPSGWTLVRRINSTAGTSNSLVVYSKTAGASEPASYSWAFSSSTGSAGGVVAFSGVDTANPIDVENGQPTPSALTHATPSVTTTVSDTMLITSHTFSSASTWNPPAGMTERVDVQGGLQSIEINTVTQAAAAATGAKTATAAADADGGNAHILALRPQSGLTISLPAGTAQNDVMVASVAVRPPAPTPTPNISFVAAAAPAVNEAGCPRSITPAIPGGNVDDLLIAQVIVREDAATVSASAGWTPLYSATYSPVGQEFRAFLYYRVATGSDALTVTASGTCNTMGGQISRFRNVDPSQPFLNVPIPGGNDVIQFSDNIDTGTETTVDATAMLVVASFINNNFGVAQGAGWSTAYESAANLNRDAAINLHYQLQSTAGAKSISNWSMGAIAANIGVIFSLRPLPAAQPSVVLTAPSGWTLVSRTDNTNGNANSLAVYVKVAGAAEPASYTWGVSGNTGVTGGIQSFVGVDTSNPIDVQNGQTTASGLAHATPSVTTTVANAMLVSSHAFSSAATWTSPAGMTQGFTASSITAPSAAGVSMQCNYVIQASAGATGAKSATAANDADTGNGHILALKPAVVGVPTPGAFNAFETTTGAGQITGVIGTRVAGTAFSLDVVAISGGAQLAGFTNPVTVELLGNAGLGTPLDGQNCPTAFTVVQTVTPNPTINAGRSTVNFAAVANVWRDVRVRVRYPVGAPTVTSCSTDNFAIRPGSFALAATDNDWQFAGAIRTLDNTAASGGVVHKAGRSFTLQATPAPVTATNYAGDPTLSALACSLPAGCANGTLVLGAFAGAGTRTSNTATYSEAGAFNLTLVDQTFASVDSADGTPANCTATGRYVCQSGAPLAVGRFVPDRFALAATTAPVFRTFDALDAACSVPPAGPRRSFTYVGQYFGYATVPAATITAQNASGGTTTNYRGALWKLNAASASQSVANAPVLALDTTLIGAPTLTEIANTGTGTLSANAGDRIAFVRDNTTPLAPFTASLALTWSVADASEAGPNQGTITTTSALVFNGIAFDSGGDFRYGRLRLANANGSQLVPLPVLMEAQYWLGVSGFVTNAADHCTSIASTNVAMGTFTGNLAACETAVSGGGTLTSGRRTLLLAAPGNANDGSVILTANLGAAPSGTTCTVVGGATSPAAGADRTYLQGNWAGALYDDNPGARATFGTFKGAGEVIFMRENF